jgi:hypothetical protein
MISDYCHEMSAVCGLWQQQYQAALGSVADSLAKNPEAAALRRLG